MSSKPSKKKIKAEKVVAPVVPEVFETPAALRSDQDTYKLDDVTRMNLMRIQAEMESAESKFNLEKMILQQYVAQIDKEGKIRGFEMNLMVHQQKLRALHEEYKVQIKDVEAKYNIDMTKCSFDDKSGIIHVVHMDAEADVEKK